MRNELKLDDLVDTFDWLECAMLLYGKIRLVLEDIKKEPSSYETLSILDAFQLSVDAREEQLTKAYSSGSLYELRARTPFGSETIVRLASELRLARLRIRALEIYASFRQDSKKKQELDPEDLRDLESVCCKRFGGDLNDE